MTKQEYLEAAALRYNELQSLNKITDFYDYETEFYKNLAGPCPEGIRKKHWDAIK